MVIYNSCVSNYLYVGVSNGRAVNRRPAAQLGSGLQSTGRAGEKSSARGPAYEPAG